MNEQTEKLIRELAEKLGTTTEHLWGVLVRQAPISAVTDLVVILGLSIFSFVLWWFCRKWAIKAQEADPCDMDPWAILAILFGIAAAIFTVMAIIAICQLDMVVAGFFNPEYWALKQIVK